MPYKVQLENFEGPLDLLLYLIRKNEVDIYDIPIAEITRQYLEYLDVIQHLDLDRASEFILMAATLIRIKAQMLLPRPELEEDEEYEDPRQELVQKLLEYQRFKTVAEALAERETEHRDLLPRSFFYFEGNGHDSEPPAPSVSLFDLIAVFKEVMQRAPERDYHAVQPLPVTVEEQIEYVVDYLAERGHALFADLIRELPDRLTMVVTFVAILELIRRGAVQVRQASPFGEIWIQKV
ncbi:MAG: segregation/condensation protein A [Calditrichaeota bacterium]|jgi:segregation and condensation protein A|nr:segregation/condensation protein A [Calditrichota bacterium]